MKKMLLKFKKNVYLVYTILFTIICSIAFYSFMKLGKTFIWGIDGYGQHYIILYNFHKMIKNGFSLFSWNIGLGSDVIGQYSYYVLGDPFAYISLLSPLKYLKYTYSILILLRIYLVGISFIIYCKYNQKNNFPTLIGAVIYTFSGYIFYAAIRHPFFTNPVIMLPLIFLGIDKILKENKYIFFTTMIAVLAIMNYYFLYMITILTIIYTIVKYIVNYRESRINDIIIRFLKIGLSYIVGILIAGVILLPTAYAFLNSNRMGSSYTYYDLTYYEKLLFGQPDTSFWSKSYVSSISLLILPIAISNFKKNKENKVFLIDVLISVIILLIPFLGSVMNGFSFQSNRWIFGYVFFISYLVTINLNKEIKYSIKKIILMGISIIIYCVLALISKQTNKMFILISLFTSSLMILSILAKNIIRKREKLITNLCRMAIILLVGINVVAYARSMYDENKGGYVKSFKKSSTLEESYSNFNNKIKGLDRIANKIKKNDKSTYRVGTTIYGSNNMPIMHNYKGLNTYLSIGNGYISNLSQDLLILGNSITNELNEFDSRTKITTLLGCKYYITPNKRIKYVPYGYKLYKKINNESKIYKNENYLGFGIFYDSYILEDDYNNLTPLEKEQALLDTVLLKQNIKNVTYNSKIVNEIKNNTTKEIGYKMIDKDNTLIIELEKNIDNSELYLYVDNLRYNGTDEYYIKVKYKSIQKVQRVSDKIKSPYYMETPNILFNLGYREEHKGVIKIQLLGSGNFNYNDLKLIAVPINQYEKSVKKLLKTQFKIKKCKNTRISGNINNKKAGILQISTPYSSGWKAYIDGKETKVLNVNKAFIGIYLDAGEHEICFKYESPYFKIGLVISVIGILILIIMIIKSRKKEVKR